MSRRPYAPHAVLTTPGKPKNAPWRLVIGLFVASLVMFGLSRGIMAVLSVLLSEDAYFDVLDAILVADTPFGLLALLFLMGGMGLGAVVAAEVMHSRSAGSLFGSRRLFWRQFWRVVGALMVLNVVLAVLPPWPLRMATEPGLPPGVWLMFLPLTLLALLVQVGSEEVLFRGYFQSQLAARVASPVIWLMLPSAAFALGHYAPEIYGGNALTVTIWAFAFGIVAGDLTARTGTLGPAIALHFVNNFIAMGVMSLQGEMSGLALMKLPFGPGDEGAVGALLPVDLVTMGVSWLAARLSLRV